MPRHQEIEFVVQDRPDLGAVEIVPAVDGVLLTTLVAAYEAAAVRACRPYGGLVPARYRFGAMDRHFRGGSTEAFGRRRRCWRAVTAGTGIAGRCCAGSG
jgi:hypothetical protein